MGTEDAILELLSALENPIRIKAVVGFDGYIDQIKKVVQKREGKHFEPFPSIATFAERLAFAAGKSAQFELVSQALKLGGNAPIMANSLGRLGFATTCVGTLGSPAIHPAFSNLPAQLISLGPPAETIALEFGDGKLILSDVKAFEDLGWEKVKEVIGVDRLEDLFLENQLLALVGWSNLPLANDLLQGILTHIMPKCAGGNQQFFFDLADPTAKPPDHIRALVQTIGAFSKFGQVTLGVNENEAIYLYQTYFPGQSLPDDLQLLGVDLFRELNLHQLVIHPLDRALLITEDGAIEQLGKVVEQPKIQTGAGDNLNAGYCLGICLGVSDRACLVAGIANSGAYVSLGHSPDTRALAQYLRTWLKSC
ncbi:MAG: ADP-dependent glucokinase/phosphofructokinase [Saprospiraceae bacterium]|nr:ADP-dependent glucokinase/phosphofructokinase [Saprospiraceae bacterium]